MADQYDNEMRFVLFKNKKQNEKSPDMTGNVVIDGKKWRLAAWTQKSRSGDTYLSGRVTEFQEAAATLEDVLTSGEVASEPVDPVAPEVT